MTESKWQPVNLEALGSAIQVGMSAFFAGLVSSSCVSIFFFFFVQNFSCSSALVTGNSEMSQEVPCSPAILHDAFAIS